MVHQAWLQHWCSPWSPHQLNVATQRSNDDRATAVLNTRNNDKPEAFLANSTPELFRHLLI
jgi:hypothetical protein